MRKINEYDKIIGKKLKTIRLNMGLARKTICNEIDITQQQLGKYEEGINRISAGKLLEIANMLKIPVNKFYEDIIYINFKN